MSKRVAESATRSAGATASADPVRDQIRAELQAEHEARLRKFAERKQTARSHARAHDNTKRRKEFEELRLAERRRFHQEQGYKEYVDSNGRSEWLPPQEYEWRMRRRRKRDRGREYQPSMLKRRREVALYAVAALAAILVGLLLIR